MRARRANRDASGIASKIACGSEGQVGAGVELRLENPVADRYRHPERPLIRERATPGTQAGRATRSADAARQHERDEIADAGRTEQ